MILDNNILNAVIAVIVVNVILGMYIWSAIKEEATTTTTTTTTSTTSRSRSSSRKRQGISNKSKDD